MIKWGILDKIDKGDGGRQGGDKIILYFISEMLKVAIQFIS